MKIKYGDIIGVRRLGGIYEHYGVFEHENRIYQYASRDGTFGSADIHTTTLRKFLGDSDNCFVLVFPESYGPPLKHEVAVFSPMTYAQKADAYHLYSPEETIQRARSRLGEAEYNLFFNNCEHYAIWCKTGIHESHQIEDLLNMTYKIRVMENFRQLLYN